MIGRGPVPFGKTNTVKIVGFDAEPSRIKAPREDTVQALVVQQPGIIGQYGVDSAVAALDGGQVTPKVQTGFTTITKDNLDGEGGSFAGRFPPTRPWRAPRRGSRSSWSGSRVHARDIDIIYVDDSANDTMALTDDLGDRLSKAPAPRRPPPATVMATTSPTRTSTACAGTRGGPRRNTAVQPPST